MITTIIVAAGTGDRTKLGFNKLLFEFDGVSIIEHTLRTVKTVSDQIVVVCNPVDIKTIGKIADKYNAQVTSGGNTRTQSVRNGLEFLRADAQKGDIVIVHNGANPFTTKEVFKDSINKAKATGSGIAVFPAIDSLRKKTGSDDSHPIDRSEIVYVQTPQTFDLIKLLEAYDNVSGDFSDDAQVYEKHFGFVTMSAGSRGNVKITTDDDLEQHAARDARIGNGYDTHKLIEGRKLILGGIEIPHKKGLLGHSDADVLVHAIIDALLSAIGSRDIGVLFPDTDPLYKGISSIKLLEEVMELVGKEKFGVKNISAVLLAQKPRLSPYVDAMRENLAQVLGVAVNEVGLSVTTTEGLGFVGREEGIACYSTVLLKRCAHS